MSKCMHSEVFLREDLAALLAGIAVAASVSGGAGSPHDAAFRRGFAAALAAMATATHIPLAAISTTTQLSAAELDTPLLTGERQLFLTRRRT